MADRAEPAPGRPRRDTGWDAEPDRLAMQRRRRLFRAGPPAAPTRPDAAEPELGTEFAELSRRGYVGSIAPPVPLAAAELQQHIERLAATGALDEGSGPVFDGVIAAWVDQWHNDVETEHRARQSLLQLRTAEAAAELERRRAHTEWVARRLEETADQLAALADPAFGRQARRRRRWFRRR